MPPITPWAGMDPNSAHQRWSRWTVRIALGPGPRPTLAEVVENARRFVRAVFQTTAGRVRVVEEATVGGTTEPPAAVIARAARPLVADVVVIQAEVEGVPVHDAGYVESVRRQFLDHFVARGFRGSTGTVEAALLAGTREDGTPGDQLLVVPSIRFLEEG